jgi:hypothetical protein
LLSALWATSLPLPVQGQAPQSPAPSPSEVSGSEDKPVAARPEALNKAGELDARIAALDAYLEDQQVPSRVYYASWVSVLSVLAAGQAGLAIFEEERAARAGLIMGSSFSALGLSLVLLAPSPGRYGHRRFRELPDGTIAEKEAKLWQGEAWLRGEVASVRRTHSLLTHALGAAMGVGAFLGLYLGYDDNLAGALRTGLGTVAVTELRVWTRTRRAARNWQAYQARPTEPPSAGLSLSPLLLPRAQGLQVAGLF